MPATPADPVLAVIALGSNLGDRAGHIQGALAAIAELPATRLITSSSVVETEAVGPVSQGRYLNAVASIETELPARELLDQLLEIERQRGRERSVDQRWGPRTLDLDLLLYGDRVISEPGLVIPHPHLHERTFVLDPLAEIAGDVVVPTLGKTIRELHRSLHDGPLPAMEGNRL